MPLPTPQGEQSDALYLPTTNNIVVLGTAGSGKSTLAVHRAAILSDPRVENHGKTLLVTFNVSLVKYLEYLAGGSPAAARFDIRNYHLFARGILASMGLNMWNVIAEGSDHEDLVSKAVANQKNATAHSVFGRTDQFFVEEFKWIAQNGITSEAEYLSKARTGRADSRLKRSDRPPVFAAYEEYLALRSQTKFKYNWDDLATAVRHQLKNPPPGFKRMYRHVVIDEGQDFSPEMIRSLSESIEPGGTITFFGDVAQQIYGHRISWKNAGIDKPLTHQFKNNYRNSRQIADLALSLSKLPTFGHTVDELVTPVVPAAAGPLPALVSLSSREATIAWAAKQAGSLSATQSVAVLARDRNFEDEFTGLAGKATKLYRGLKAWKNTHGIYYGTIHAAKGLEFDTVLVLFCGADEIAEDHWMKDLDADEAQAVISKLLYVAITRARRNLVICHVGPLTHLLPTDSALYAKA